MRRLFYFAPILAIMAVSACETIQGAGRDMQTAGQMITQQGGYSGGGAVQQVQPAVSDPFANQGGF